LNRTYHIGVHLIWLLDVPRNVLGRSGLCLSEVLMKASELRPD